MTPILIPGNMCDARLWTQAVRAAVPGALDADTSLDDSVEAMAGRALSSVEGRVLPIGFSMGAIVALAMAVKAPTRIGGAILVGLNAGADLPQRAAHRPLQQAEVRAGGLERVLVEELKPNYLGAANRGDAHLLELLRDMGMALGPDVFVRQSEALRKRPDLTAALRMIEGHVALLCGEEDQLCPPVWHRRWQALSPHATLTVVPGAGHMLPLESPDSIVAAIEILKLEAPL